MTLSELVKCLNRNQVVKELNINQMMKEQSIKKHLKSKYVACISSTPIFFTAPHTKLLQRGGKEYDEKLRIHNRQMFASFLAIDFAKATGKNSFMFWGVSNVVNEQDMDPNYLLKQHFSKSPFHQSLHHWALKSQGRPLLHVDIHGKLDRQNDCNIDVGIRSMQAHWNNDPLIQKIHKFFKQHNPLFVEYKFGKHGLTFDTNPSLHGYWGGGIHTMNEQAIILGIPSIQLQIPLSVRKRLFKDLQLRSKVQMIIKKLYDTVIVPDSLQSKRKYGVSEQLANLFKTTIVRGKQQDEVYQQITVYENKQLNNPSQKKNI